MGVWDPPACSCRQRPRPLFLVLSPRFSVFFFFLIAFFLFSKRADHVEVDVLAGHHIFRLLLTNWIWQLNPNRDVTDPTKSFLTAPVLSWPSLVMQHLLFWLSLSLSLQQAWCNPGYLRDLGDYVSWPRGLLPTHHLPYPYPNILTRLKSFWHTSVCIFSYLYWYVDMFYIDSLDRLQYNSVKGQKTSSVLDIEG